MCKYCEESKCFSSIDDDESNVLYISNNNCSIIAIHYQQSTDDPLEDYPEEVETEFKINYCPMCGKAL